MTTPKPCLTAVEKRKEIKALIREGRRAARNYQLQCRLQTARTLDELAEMKKLPIYDLAVRDTKKQLAAAVAEAVGESMVLKCEDCGLPYQDFGLDSTLSHEQWAMIHPKGEGGLLCANCMVSRASHIDGAVAMRMQIDGEDSAAAIRTRGEEVLTC